MISLRAIRSILNTSALILLLGAMTPSLSLADQFKVINVYDGDTIRVSRLDNQFNVRLAGIDAPEICGDRRDLGQPYSNEAKGYLSQEILGKMVDIKGYGHGIHDLILGVVYLDGKDINLGMLREGLAEVYRGKNPEALELSPYLDAEKEAFQAKIGIWSQGDKYMSPREWRRTVKAKSACAIILYGISDPKGH